MAVVAHLQQRGVRGLVYWHTPNNVHGSRRRDYVAGAIHKAMGARAGVSDLIAVHAGRIYALELKAPGGRPSEAQLEFINDMERAGAFTCIAEGLDQALRVLEQWQLLRGKAA